MEKNQKNADKNNPTTPTPREDSSRKGKGREEMDEMDQDAFTTPGEGEENDITRRKEIKTPQADNDKNKDRKSM